MNASEVMRLDRAGCMAQLVEHDVAVREISPREAPEVKIPVRVQGPVAGVRFVIPWSHDMERDPHAIWDCRLVLAMVPLAAFLRASGIDEVQYFSALRRGSIARAKPRSQHNVGLAIDILGVRSGGGALRKVEDWYPRRSLRSCAREGVDARRSPGALYTALVCHAHDHGLVHTLLTPDHDRAHHNHLHLDLKAGQASPPDPYISFHGHR